MKYPFVLKMATVLLAIPQLAAGETGLRETPHFRRPVAAAVCDEGCLLGIVNRRSGSVSLIDLDTLRVIAEVKIGERLSHVAPLPDHKTLLITDEARHELLLVQPSPAAVQVIGRIATPRYPVRVAVSPDGQCVAVASLWSHRIALLKPTAPDGSTPGDDPTSLSPQPNFVTTDVIRIPFAPRAIAFVGDETQRLIVADAFGGQIAVIDPASGELASVRQLPVHNIRDMAASPDGSQLLLTHQVLNPLARTDFDDIHWGNLLQNVIRSLSVTTLLDPQADLLDGSRRIRLGQTGNAAADPAGIAVLTGITEERPDGAAWIVALAGVNQVAIERNSVRLRHDVGIRPVGVLWDEQRQQTYVVSSLDDSVTVLNDELKAPQTIALGPLPTLTPRDRGERLFYDAARSHDGWMSCHSCHADGHTSGGIADTLSDGSYATPKQIPSLLGVRDANPWGWNGQFRELHAQVAASFTSTLNGDPLSPPEINDIVAFLHTLRSPPPPDEGDRTEQDRRRIRKGRGLFESLGCRDCHVPPVTYSIDQTFDVGLSDEAGQTRFNPPSLRGIGQRRAFLHDGRAGSLEAALRLHAAPLSRPLSAEERQSLAAFLQSL